MRPTTETLTSYVAHCPSCGQRLRFAPGRTEPSMESVSGECPCGKRWSFIFDLDPSGTFGVMSFQCDNEDRIL